MINSWLQHSVHYTSSSTGPHY